MTDAPRTIEISPVTRVEGHGKVTILLDQDDRVRQVRLHIVEFRGFERFIQGHPYWEVPVLVQRLCGICPVSHHLCAAKAVDGLVGGEKLTPTAEKMRRLMHYGQMFQSHALHFFHLASPDLLFGFGAPAAERNVIAVAGKFPELGKQGIMMRKYGQEIIRTPVLDRMAEEVNADQEAKAALRPQPMRSLLVDDCIDAGVEPTVEAVLPHLSVRRAGRPHGREVSLRTPRPE